MEIQTSKFAIQKTQNGAIMIGRSSILQPKTNFKGGSVKWYNDKPKSDEPKMN